MHLSLRKTSLIYAFSLLSIACDSGENGKTPSPTGNYLLATVNGASVPYEFVNEQGTTVLKGGHVTLDESKDFEFTLEYDFTSTSDTNVFQSDFLDTGTWAVDGEMLSISWEGPHTTFYDSVVRDASIMIQIGWYPDFRFDLVFERQ